MHMKFYSASLTLLMLAALFASCDNTPSLEEQREIDRQIIEDYVAQNGLNGEFTQTGIYYEVTDSTSSTERPNAASNVEVIYTGKLLEGTVFDSSEGFPVTFNLQRVIRGWTEGIQYFAKGEKGYLILPSHMAYGRNGTNTIPPNTVLYFDIELLDFTN